MPIAIINSNSFQARAGTKIFETESSIIENISQSSTAVPERRLLSPSKFRLKPLNGSTHGNSLSCHQSIETTISNEQ